MKKLKNFTFLLISSALFFVFTSLFAANIKIVSIIALCLSVLTGASTLISLVKVIKGFIQRTNEQKNVLIVVIGLFITFAFSYFGIRNFFWVEDSGFVSITENNVYIKDNQGYFIIEDFAHNKDIHYKVSDDTYKELFLHLNLEYTGYWNKLDRGYSRHLELNLD